jgi:hypothetical protein
MTGIIDKEEELDEVLKQKNTKISVLSETKKIQVTKYTRNYSVIYIGVKK